MAHRDTQVVLQGLPLPISFNSKKPPALGGEDWGHLGVVLSTDVDRWMDPSGPGILELRRDEPTDGDRRGSLLETDAQTFFCPQGGAAVVRSRGFV